VNGPTLLSIFTRMRSFLPSLAWWKQEGHRLEITKSSVLNESTEFMRRVPRFCVFLFVPLDIRGAPACLVRDRKGGGTRHPRYPCHSCRAWKIPGTISRRWPANSHLSWRMPCTARTFVRFSRRFEQSAIRGYVLDVGPRFFLFALVSDRIWFDGFECFASVT
jgi:hypothetical protein